MAVKFKGFWLDRKHYLWLVDGYTGDWKVGDETWGVPCACSYHFDHAACTKGCLSCNHPVGVIVEVQKVSPSGSVEMVLNGLELEGERPKKKSRKSSDAPYISKTWVHTLEYAATALEASADNGDRYCANQIRDYLFANGA